MRVFVVICHDRHCDDGISVHASREGADRHVEQFKAGYAEMNIEIEWSESNDGRDSGWVRCVRSYDDGPSARIEAMELDP